MKDLWYLYQYISGTLKGKILSGDLYTMSKGDLYKGDHLLDVSLPVYYNCPVTDAGDHA